MKLNVAYSTDENYVRHLGVSMTSLLENNKDFSEICVYIIESKISDKSKHIFQEIASDYGRNVKFISFDLLATNLRVDNTFSIMSYGRLFLGKLVDIDKIIYLDCDSIIDGSLFELWAQDISDYYIGGVQDTVNIFYLTSIGLDRSSKYINAGFLIINLRKWREDGLEEKFINFINKYNGSVPHHDQGTINGVCKEKILILEPRFNLQCPMFHYNSKQIKALDNLEQYYNQEQLDSAKNNPVFIHYTNGFFNRPWNKKCTHPLVNTYLKYLEMSPWNGLLLEAELCRNTKIMKFLYQNSPFFLYRKIWQFIAFKKMLKLQKITIVKKAC